MNIERKKTKCPHCGSLEFIPAVIGNRGLAVHNVSLQTVEDLERGNIIIGGSSEPIYIKACTQCGYLGFFSKQIIDKNGSL